jgi:hypothetical protein
MRSRTVRLLMQRFTLEAGLVAGATLFAIGVGVDGWILSKWLATGRGAMEETVHLAFVGATIAVLGINVSFGSFLLSLIRADRPDPA